ncbi:YibE/F family protein [Carnobacterium viridans]|uniref:YibE/F-like protein n=1 Tax=Carnobacterium viridans TaxID=174587 RepID=A0A1H0ZDC9_9LACT|nr:YibE/F family protein [Carnobacterium viridans]UDE94684.1 YibE/F family protein [Carnobacterium viridans]SDQ25430.1 YibE/F-like protein [Carnobacterium viridans]
MNVLVCLSIILFVLMKLISGEKGTRSFIALFLNFGITLLTVLLMTREAFNPIFLTMIACIFISCINLFYINTINLKSVISFIATLMTLFFLVGLIFIFVEKAMIQGFGIEEIEELSFFNLYVGVNFLEIASCTIIMGSIGAITDTSISISSAMNEIFIHNPFMDRYNLFKSGMNVGKDILGTTTNTLYFAFIGGYLALIVWFKDLSYSLSEVINSKVFSSEVISIFCIGTGAILIIPITAWLTAFMLTRRKKNVSVSEEV